MVVSYGRLEENLSRGKQIKQKKRGVKYKGSHLQVGLGGQHRPRIDVVSNFQAEEFLKFGDVVIDYIHSVGRDQEN